MFACKCYHSGAKLLFFEFCTRSVSRIRFCINANPNTYLLFMENKKRLLIVEDDEALRTVYEMLFRKKYDVICASDGIEGIMKFTSQRIDIILSDIVMPKMDGVEMAKIIRASSQIPIVFVTGYSNYKPQDLIEKGLANKVLAKPFVVESIEESLTVCLR